jgi:deoxyadenosine/deoxycytidine kinase
MSKGGGFIQRKQIYFSCHRLKGLSSKYEEVYNGIIVDRSSFEDILQDLILIFVSPSSAKKLFSEI